MRWEIGEKRARQAESTGSFEIKVKHNPVQYLDGWPFRINMYYKKPEACVLD